MLKRPGLASPWIWAMNSCKQVYIAAALCREVLDNVQQATLTCLIKRAVPQGTRTSRKMSGQILALDLDLLLKNLTSRT